MFAPASKIRAINARIAALVILLTCVWCARAEAPAPLKTLSAIHALTNEQARLALPVVFEATVTFFRASEGTLFVQDGNAAIYVSPPANAELVPGDRVRIEGITHADFSPTVAAQSITLLHHGAMPAPVPATFDDLIRARRDCMLVAVRGVIRTVDAEMRTDTRNPNLPMRPLARVQMLIEGGYIEALVDGDTTSLSTQLDAEAEVTGIATFGFDGKMQPTGLQLEVSSSAGFRLLHPAKADPWEIPAAPIDRVLAGYHVQDLTRRIRVHGTITYYLPGSAVVIQDGSRSLWISTMTRGNLTVGDTADAIGFPDVHRGPTILTRAEVSDTHNWAPVSPQPVTVKQLMSSGNLFDLVSIEGQVAKAVREAAQDEYVLVSNGQIFTAIYRHPDGKATPMKEIPEGSTVRVDGICIMENSNPFNAQVPFDILLRSTDDIVVVAKPSIVNTRNLIFLVALLLTVLSAVGARAWLVERRARRQTAAMASIERRRSKILEDISGSRPLMEILAEVVELVSVTLDGVPCWCQMGDGASAGDPPNDPENLRIVREEIPGNSSGPPSRLFAAFPPFSKPSPVEADALTMGAGLAALAIETRRLYADLIHRSQFDMLTEVHNRFSLDRRLDALIREVRLNGGAFGLIYIDLDDSSRSSASMATRSATYTSSGRARTASLRTVRPARPLEGTSSPSCSRSPHPRRRQDLPRIRTQTRCADRRRRLSPPCLRQLGIALFPRTPSPGTACSRQPTARCTRPKTPENRLPGWSTKTPPLPPALRENH